jgi:hypothetical protein
MLKPKVIKEVAVLTQDISVRSWESIVRSKENLTLASAAIASSIDNPGDVVSFWLDMWITPFSSEEWRVASGDF